MRVGRTGGALGEGGQVDGHLGRLGDKGRLPRPRGVAGRLHGPKATGWPGGGFGAGAFGGGGLRVFGLGGEGLALLFRLPGFLQPGEEEGRVRERDAIVGRSLIFRILTNYMYHICPYRVMSRMAVSRK